MALPATDDFNSATTQALTTYSSNWTNNVGTPFVQALDSGSARGADSGAPGLARWNADTFDADQYSEGTIVTFNGVTATTAGVATRLGSSGRPCYTFDATYTNQYLFRQNTTDRTLLSSAPQNPSDGDVFRLESSGTTHTCSRNGSTNQCPSAQTDSTHTSGSAGVSFVGTSVYPSLGDWEGGNLGGAAPADALGWLAASVHRRNRSHHIRR